MSPIQGGGKARGRKKRKYYGQLGTAWHCKDPTGPGRKKLPVFESGRWMCCPLTQLRSNDAISRNRQSVSINRRTRGPFRWGRNPALRKSTRIKFPGFWICAHIVRRLARMRAARPHGNRVRRAVELRFLQHSFPFRCFGQLPCSSLPNRSTVSSVSRTSSQVVVWFTMHSRRVRVP